MKFKFSPNLNKEAKASILFISILSYLFASLALIPNNNNNNELLSGAGELLLSLVLFPLVTINLLITKILNKESNIGFAIFISLMSLFFYLALMRTNLPPIELKQHQWYIYLFLSQLYLFLFILFKPNQNKLYNMILLFLFTLLIVGFLNPTFLIATFI